MSNFPGKNNFHEYFSKGFYDNFDLMAISRLDDGCFVEVNKKMCEETGLAREEIVGKTSIELKLFTDSQRQKIKDILQEKGFISGEEIDIFLVKKNKHLTCLFYAYILDFDGEKYLLSLVHDITHLKKVEKELRLERDKARKYLDEARSILVGIDVDQKVTLINKKGCQIIGLPEEDIVGRNWFDNFVPEDERDRVKDSFNQLIKGELSPFEYYENSIINADGKKILIAWHNNYIRDEEGNIISTLSSGEDITEKKKMENALKEKVHDLEIFYKASVEREERIIELKEENKLLKNKLHNLLEKNRS